MRGRTVRHKNDKQDVSNTQWRKAAAPTSTCTNPTNRVNMTVTDDPRDKKPEDLG